MTHYGRRERKRRMVRKMRVNGTSVKTIVRISRDRAEALRDKGKVPA